MANILVAVLLWALVIVLLLFRRARRERSVLYSAIAIASAMTMSIDPLYLIVDGWFGAHDYIHLASCIILMVGVFYFARGVTRVGLITSAWVKMVLGPTTLIVSCFLVSTGFFLTVRHEDVSSTNFMISYGDQIGAALYSIAQYAYLGFVLSSMVVTSQRQRREAGSRREKALASLLFVGSWIGVALSIDVIMMDIAHVAGWDAVLSIGQMLYSPLQMLTFLFLVLGLTLAPTTRWVRQVRRSRTMRSHLDRVELLWRNATSARPSVAHAIERRAANDEDRLHRRIVEIRDSALDKSNSFQLTENDLNLLAELEDQLIAGTV